MFAIWVGLSLAKLIARPNKIFYWVELDLYTFIVNLILNQLIHNKDLIKLDHSYLKHLYFYFYFVERIII